MELHCHSDKHLCLQAVLRQVRSPWASKVMAAEEFLERQTMLLLQVSATPLHVELLQHVLQQFVRSAGTLQGGLSATCFHSQLTPLSAEWHSVADALHSLQLKSDCRLPVPPAVSCTAFIGCPHTSSCLAAPKGPQPHYCSS